MQYPQPLQMSSCTTTVPNSVRTSAPVGQTSRQAACVQCLHTSEAISQRVAPGSPSPSASPEMIWSPSSSLDSADAAGGSACSMNATWRQLFDPRAAVLSYDIPVILSRSPSGSGSPFHSLQATSQAL